MADKRAYAKFDIGYLHNPKMLDVLDVSHTAVLMHAFSVLYSAQHLTDGHVPVGLCKRHLGATQADVDVLIEVGLWHAAGHECPECEQPTGRSIVVHNFLEHNRSEAEANKLSKAGAKGAQARWGNDPPASDPQSESHANGNADRIRTAMATPSENRNGQRERKRDPSKEGGAGGKARKTPRTPYPDELTINDLHRARAKEFGVDVDWEFQKFTDHHQSKDSRFADWSKAFHTWLRNAAEYAAGRTGPPPPPTVNRPDPWTLGPDAYLHPEERARHDDDDDRPATNGQSAAF